MLNPFVKSSKANPNKSPQIKGVTNQETKTNKNMSHSAPLKISAALLDRQTAASLLGVSLRTIDNLISSGDLAAVHIGRAVRLRPSAIDYFIEANETRANPRTAQRAKSNRRAAK